MSAENSKNNDDVKRIKVLEKKVAELIAAGEVVERPASAVKELVENAIDAGAGAITLEIKNGGVSFIRVTDNGCGIMREDVPAAFLRHATSKVSTEDDLEAIGTLGFRGEALASISAVSKTEMITRTHDELAGTHIFLEGGEIVESGDAGCPVGTTIIVRELFYNTPARMKFLKKDTTEGNAVAAVAQRIALSHPEVSLRFIKDGREELHTPGDNRLISAVHSVLGREFASSLLKADYTFSHMHVEGYITKPLSARPNRNMQFFFLNGRLIKSKTMMAAVEEAYKNSIMTGKYPGCVLHISLNAALADVNVHPSKLEVRFADERGIFDAVYYAAKNALLADSERPALNISDRKTAESADYIKASAIITPERPFSSVSDNFQSCQDEKVQQLKLIMKNTPLQPERQDFNVVCNTVRAAYEPVAGGSFLPETAEAESEQTETAASPGHEVEEENVVTAEMSTTFQDGGDIRIIGQCFDTYIMAQKGDSLWLIDKHAAHERILYEEIKRQRKACAQVLLEPVAVTLTADEYSVIIENAELLAQSGIAAEDFGASTLIVREAPLDLSGQDIKALISEIAGLLIAHKKDITPARLDWIYHSVACRAAIKSGDRTTPQEMQQLAERVLNFSDIMFCPHGRPVAFELPKADIEKKFGR